MNWRVFMEVFNNKTSHKRARHLQNVPSRFFSWSTSVSTNALSVSLCHCSAFSVMHSLPVCQNDQYLKHTVRFSRGADRGGDVSFVLSIYCVFDSFSVRVPRPFVCISRSRSQSGEAVLSKLSTNRLNK